MSSITQFTLNNTSKAALVKKYGGGKAYGLFNLNYSGLNVPDWSCIDSRFFDLKLNQVVKEIEELLNTRLVNKLLMDEIQTKIMTIQFSDKEKEYLNSLFNCPIAVRSSSTSEDGKFTSFAGVYETFLFVDSKIDFYIKKCWASIYTVEHIQYLKQHNIPLKNIKMAVVLQEMIDSDKSGIYFQSHPNGNINQHLIVAGHGLGQGVVDGIIPVDTYTYNPLNNKFYSNIGNKDSMLSFNFENKKIEERKVDNEKRIQSVLESSQIKTLIEECKKIKSKGILFHDIEWTIKDNNLYFLQSRPITTVSQSSKIQLYDNSNIIENYPGITLPLTASNLKRLYGVNFECLLLRVGVPYEKLDYIRPYVYELTESFEGRIYYQVYNWHKILELIPFFSFFIKKSWNQMIGVQTSAQLKGKKWDVKEQVVMLKRTAYSFYKAIFQINSEQNSYQKEFHRFYEHYKSIDQSQFTKLELAELYQDAELDFFGFTNKALFNDLVTSILLSICKKFANNDLDLLARLTQNDENLESYKLILSTKKLSSSIKDNNFLIDKISETIETKNLNILKLAAPNFFQDFESHLEKYGDRSMEEMKFEIPTTRENPFDFLHVLVEYSKLTDSIEETTINVKKHISNPLKRKVLIYFINKYQQALDFRELSRLNRARMKGLMRNFLLELGNRLSKENRLENPDDIFYLNESFLISNLRGSFSYIPKVDDEKLRIEKYKNYQFPTQFILNDQNFDPDWFINVDSEIDKSDELSGTGCHGELIKGEVIICHSPSITEDVSNKILVTKSTDPGWVFLMMKAKALIVERGNLLSHAAIIGREIGIPTIIGVQNVTQILKTGDYIEMNGKSGKIKISP